MTFIATQKTLKHSFGKVRTAKRIRIVLMHDHIGRTNFTRPSLLRTKRVFHREYINVNFANLQFQNVAWC